MTFVKEGTFKDCAFHTLISEIIKEKASGYLTVSGESDIVELCFEFGLCVGAESHYPKDNMRLGQMLIVRGFLNESQLEEFLAKQKVELVKLGVMARRAGFINALQLIEVLEHQLLMIVYPCFTWVHGVFQFRNADVIPYDKDSMRPIDLSDYSSDGNKILKAQSWVTERLPDFTRIPSLVPEKEVLPPGVQIDSRSSGSDPKIVLTVEQDQVYNIVNPVFPIEKIILATNLFPFKTIKALIDLMDLGVIQIPTVKRKKTQKKIVPDFKSIISGFSFDFRWLGFGLGGALALLISYFFIGQLFPRIPPKKDLSIMTTSTRVKMDQLRYSLATFHLMNQKYPDFLNELAESNVLREKDLLDAWGSKFYYRKSDSTFMLISEGPDKEWSTNDDIEIEGNIREHQSGSFFPVWISVED